MLLARIDEVFPRICPRCGADLRIIAFITDPSTVRDIVAHLGEPMAPPRCAPARGPPLWEMPRDGHRAIDPQAPSAPDYKFDQRLAWSCRRNPNRCWSGTVRAGGHRCGKRPPRQVAPGTEASRP